MVDVTIIAAFVAGVVSFLSPCVLPLLPGFLAYLAGISPNAKNARWHIFTNSAAYVLGFAAVFSLLGVLLNTVLESASYDVQTWLARIGGAFIIVLGMHIAGIITLSFLEQEHSIKVRRFGSTHLTSFLFGAAFAVGWTPCVGAILGSILVLAASQPGMSFVLLLSYTLGLGIPFLILGAFSKEALSLISKLGPYLKWFRIVMGVILITIGVLVFTQTLAVVASFGFVDSVLAACGL